MPLKELIRHLEATVVAAAHRGPAPPVTVLDVLKPPRQV
jgi:hypothetical protein